ncbi:MAG: sporulation protein YqfC [Bacillota bacterium]
MRRKDGLRDRLVSLLELPGDAMLDVARITVVGDMEMVIENHRGLNEYTPDRVVMTVPEGQICIDGEGLQIGSISPEQVILLGKIRGMRYLGRSEGAT